MSSGVRRLRRSTQIVVLVFLVIVPVLAWYGSHGGSGPVGAALRSARERVDVHGDSWSAHVFGLSVLDPLGGIEALASGSASIPLLLASVAVPLLLTALLGRVFCSWICPAGLLFEMSDALRGALARRGLSPGTAKLWRGHKYVLLLVGVAVSAVVGLPLLSHFYPPALVAREIHRAVFEALGSGPAFVSATGATLFLFGIILVEVFVSPRAWCRSLCPGGAIYGLVGRRRSVRVRRVASRCTDCGDCVVACPMDLDPMRDRMGVECDNCQECVANCPENALKLTLSFASGPLAPTGEPRPRGGS